MAQFRCLYLDVDGVLTDGRILVAQDGSTSRAFHIHDGLAIRAFQRLGGTVVIVTGKTSGSVAHRAQELGIEHVIQGSDDKLSDLTALLKNKLHVPLNEIAAIGDDLPDLPVLQDCGYPMAPANAVAEVRQAARFVTVRRGGDGAVREAIEHLLQLNGQSGDMLKLYTDQPMRGERSQESISPKPKTTAAEVRP